MFRSNTFPVELLSKLERYIWLYRPPTKILSSILLSFPPAASALHCNSRKRCYRSPDSPRQRNPDKCPRKGKGLSLPGSRRFKPPAKKERQVRSPGRLRDHSAWRADLASWKAPDFPSEGPCQAIQAKVLGRFLSHYQRTGRLPPSDGAFLATDGNGAGVFFHFFEGDDLLIGSS